MNHILVLDLGEIGSSLSHWPNRDRECTLTFTRQIERARDVLRVYQPCRVLLNIEEETAEVIDFIEIALKSGARVIAIESTDSNPAVNRTISHPDLKYVSEPVELETLWNLMETPDLPEDPYSKCVHIHKPAKSVVHFGTLPSQCDEVRDILDQILRVATTSVTVLLTGESGTGKEIAARVLHEESNRKEKPFVAINCGAISPQLIESELFGHERGSFTGAVKEHHGVFEQAHGGTLFLDEITEMPVDLQVKLLRVLENHTFTRLGGNREHTVDVRIIAATNRSPEREVEDGRLRADLLYRIQVFPIYLPPLRQRMGDLQIIAEHFLAELNRMEGSRKVFSSDVWPAMARYSWPGNLRELKNVVQRSYIMADQIITPAELPADIKTSHESVRPRGSSLTVHVGMSVSEVEEQLIVATLNQCKGKRDRAARLLGVSVKTLYNRLKEYEEQTMQNRSYNGLSVLDGYRLRDQD